MGADITTEGRVALVRGVERLHGARVEAADLRGGGALAAAALGAEGVTPPRDAASAAMTGAWASVGKPG